MPLIPDKSVLGENSVLGVVNDEERLTMVEAITSSLEMGSPLIDRSNGRSNGADLSYVDPGFNPFTSENLSGYEEEALNDAFDGVFNERAMEVKKAQIDFERRQDRLAEAYPIVSPVAEIIGGLLSPTTLMPGGALIRGGKLGYSALKSGASVSAYAAAASTADEIALRSQQVTRGNEDSALAIGGSVFLGAILGSAGAKFLTKSEWDKASKSIEIQLEGDDEAVQAASQIVNQIQGLSADAVEELTLDDLSIGGPAVARAWAAISAKLKIAPAADILQSPSLQTRKTFVQLAENSIRTQSEIEGRKIIDGSVETSVKQFTLGEFGQWMTGLKTSFRNARSDGFTGSKVEFDRMVGMAMRRGDRDINGNAHVEEVAQTARQRIVDPLLKRAQDLNLLPTDVQVTTAQSYFMRVWNTQLIIARENILRDRIRPWFKQQLDDALFKQEEIAIARNISDYDELSDRLSVAEQKLSESNKRLKGRKARRGALSNDLATTESGRLEAIAARPPAALRQMLEDPEANDVAVKAARTAQKGNKAPRTRNEKYPVLEIIKNLGGVRKGSVLESELKSMGVTAKQHPGLYKSGSGLGDIDNLPLSDHKVLGDNLFDVDGTGYAARQEVLDAIADELSGSPLLPEELMQALGETANAEQFVKEWLEAVGLPENATLGDIRKFINAVQKSERNLTSMDAKINRLRGDLDNFDESTDGILDSHKIKDAEAKALQLQVRDLEAKIAKSADLVDASPRIKRMVDYATAKRDLSNARIKKHYANKKREGIERVPEADRSPEMRLAATKAADEIKEFDAVIAKNEKVAEKLKKTLPKEKPELTDFVNEADYDGYLEDAITGTINNLSGRGGGDVPEWLVPLKRGPLKERTFAIPDEVIEDFLISDGSTVLDRYTRTMSAEVALTEKFGRADMADQIQSIRQDYEGLRKAATSEKELTALRKKEDDDLLYLEAWRDKIRGNYRRTENSQWADKAARSLGLFNVITKLGDVVAGSLTDAGRPIGINGMVRTFGSTIPSLAARTREIKITKTDLKYMGPASDIATSHRMMTLTDVNDPHAAGSSYERLLSNVSHKFMRFTLLPQWNDFMRSVQSIGSQSRLADNVMKTGDLGRWERQYMAELNVREEYWPRIAAQIQKYGSKDSYGTWGVHIERWDDDVARRSWTNAINKDASRGTLNLGIADTPLWMDQPGWRLAMQFKGFLIGANQKILIAGLQGRPAYFAQGLVFATAMGMFGSYVKALTRGDTDEAERLLDNPGLWIASGLDRSGFFPLIFEPSNIMEKIGSPYGVTPAIQALFQDDDRGGASSRYVTRNAFGAVFGPSVGVVEDLARVFSQLAQGDLKPSGVNAMLRNLPGNTLPGARTAVHAGLKPWLQDAVE